MDTKQVVVSGTVGKQVFAASTSNPVILRGFNIVPISAAGYVKIRDGNASGDVKMEFNSTSNLGEEVEFPGKGMKFTKGMHVKVLGTGCVLYLWID